MGHLGGFCILLIGPLTCLCVWGKLREQVVLTRVCKEHICCFTSMRILLLEAI